MQPDGSLFSGRDALPILKNLEDMGAAAVGLNCVPASHLLPATVARFRRVIRGPLSVKPNAGDPVIGPDKLAHYPMGPEEFASIARECLDLGANLLGGCCGSVSGWAEDAMRWAVSAKIIAGSGGKIQPQGTATRAQVATVLKGFADWFAIREGELGY